MNIHDDFIKKANKEIDKLIADIEKKKSRISELRSQIKLHEAEKTRDSEFSDKVMKLLNDNGVNSDEERKTILSKFEEFMLEMEMKKTDSSTKKETVLQTESSISDSATNNSNVDNIHSDTSSDYENPKYSYRPTGNINQ